MFSKSLAVSEFACQYLHSETEDKGTTLRSEALVKMQTWLSTQFQKDKKEDQKIVTIFYLFYKAHRDYSCLLAFHGVDQEFEALFLAAETFFKAYLEDRSIPQEAAKQLTLTIKLNAAIQEIIDKMDLGDDDINVDDRLRNLNNVLSLLDPQDRLQFLLRSSVINNIDDLIRNHCHVITIIKKLPYKDWHVFIKDVICIYDLKNSFYFILQEIPIENRLDFLKKMDKSRLKDCLEKPFSLLMLLDSLPVKDRFIFLTSPAFRDGVSMHLCAVESVDLIFAKIPKQDWQCLIIALGIKEEAYFQNRNPNISHAELIDILIEYFLNFGKLIKLWEGLQNKVQYETYLDTLLYAIQGKLAKFFNDINNNPTQLSISDISILATQLNQLIMRNTFPNLNGFISALVVDLEKNQGASFRKLLIANCDKDYAVLATLAHNVSPIEVKHELVSRVRAGDFKSQVQCDTFLASSAPKVWATDEEMEDHINKSLIKDAKDLVQFLKHVSLEKRFEFLVRLRFSFIKKVFIKTHLDFYYLGEILNLLPSHVLSKAIEKLELDYLRSIISKNAFQFFRFFSEEGLFNFIDQIKLDVFKSEIDTPDKFFDFLNKLLIDLRFCFLTHPVVLPFIKNIELSFNDIQYIQRLIPTDTRHDFVAAWIEPIKVILLNDRNRIIDNLSMLFASPQEQFLILRELAHECDLRNIINTPEKLFKAIAMTPREQHNELLDLITKQHIESLIRSADDLFKVIHPLTYDDCESVLTILGLGFVQKRIKNAAELGKLFNELNASLKEICINQLGNYVENFNDLMSFMFNINRDVRLSVIKDFQIIPFAAHFIQDTADLTTFLSLFPENNRKEVSDLINAELQPELTAGHRQLAFR